MIEDRIKEAPSTRECPRLTRRLSELDCLLVPRLYTFVQIEKLGDRILGLFEAKSNSVAGLGVQHELRSPETVD
jgi:hypothetical protein